MQVPTMNLFLLLFCSVPQASASAKAGYVPPSVSHGPPWLLRVSERRDGPHHPQSFPICSAIPEAGTARRSRLAVSVRLWADPLRSRCSVLLRAFLCNMPVRRIYDTKSMNVQEGSFITHFYCSIYLFHLIGVVASSFHLLLFHSIAFGLCVTNYIISEALIKKCVFLGTFFLFFPLVDKIRNTCENITERPCLMITSCRLKTIACKNIPIFTSYLPSQLLLKKFCHHRFCYAVA